MHAFILAAGKPDFVDLPLTEVPVGDTSILDVQSEVLAQANIDRITVVVGFKAEAIAPRPVEIVANSDWASQGSVGSLRKVTRQIEEAEDIVLIYGDCLFTPRSAAQLLTARGDVAALCFLDRTNADIGKYREFAFIRDGVVAEICPEVDRAGTRAVFAGMLRIRQAKKGVLVRLLRDRSIPDQAHLGTLLGALGDHGIEIVPVIVEDGWFEVRASKDVESALYWIHEQKIVVPLRTDWAARASNYNKLDWANNDQLLAAMINAAVAQQPNRILDVGVGTGKVLMGLKASGLGREHWGVDISAAMLSKIPAECEFRLSVENTEELAGIPDNYFDLVTARMVFHHVSRTVQAASRVRQKLADRGLFIVCEGVPPSQRTVDWYTKMFRYKEDRHTLPEGDLINIFVRAGFEEIRTSTVVMRRASLNNWLDNSGIPQENIDTIKRMHFEAPDYVKEDYDMDFSDGDCYMTWRFAVVTGRKP